VIATALTRKDAFCLLSTNLCHEDDTGKLFRRSSLSETIPLLEPGQGMGSPF